MKNHIWLFSLICVLYYNSYAQDSWQQVDGLYGGNIKCLFSNSEYIFAGTNDGVYSRNKSDNAWNKCSISLNRINILCGISLSNDWIIVGSDKNGLYLTKDNGVQWSLIGFSGQSVTSLTLTPNGKIYIISDGSIYSSASNGTFWSLITQPNNAKNAFGLITPGNGIIFFKYNSNNGDLYKSIDDGVTWNRCVIHIDNNYDQYSVSGNIFCDSDSTIYFWGSSSVYGTDNEWKDLVKSSDLGVTWQRFNLTNTTNIISSMLKDDNDYFLAIHPYAMGWSDVSQIGLFKSGDGINWNMCNIGLPQYACITSIFKNDNQLIVGLSNGGIFSSTDNGITWAIEKINQNSFDKMISINDVIISTSKNNGGGTIVPGLYLTKNNNNWIYSGLAGANYYSLAFSSKDEIIYAGVSFFDSVYPQTDNPSNRQISKGIYSSSDFGASWDLLSSTKDLIVGGFQGSNCGLAVNNDGWIFAAFFIAEQTNLYRSKDKGESWELTGLTAIKGNPEITIMRDNTIFIFVDNDIKKLYRSTNNGDSWDIISEGEFRFNKLASTPNGILIAATRGSDYSFLINSKIIKSTDNGNSWVNLYSGSYYEIFSDIIAFDDTKFFASSRLNGILCSFDSGKTWGTLNSGLPSYPQGSKVVPNKFPINDIDISNDGYLYCTTDDNGIFKSTTPFALTKSLNTQIKEGWNIVSVPLSISNMSSDLVFPIKSSDVFSYNNGYKSESLISLSRGYWVKSPGNYDVKYSGMPTSESNIQISAGWNMIGPYDSNLSINALTTTPQDILASSFFAYNNGYLIPTILEPGKGYWIKANLNGVINFPSGIPKVIYDNSSLINNNWLCLTVKDAVGKNSSLYLAKEQKEVTKSELPPTPPAGIFDVRWSSNRFIEYGRVKELLINGAEYPVIISAVGGDFWIKDVIGGKIINQKVMNGESITITNKAVVKVSIEELEIPTEFRLMQNYPNPFNPETKIEYWIPNTGKVTLKIYDILGRELETLIDLIQEAGKYEMKWNATNYSSGVYFYNLTSGSNHSVKKMLLLK